MRRNEQIDSMLLASVLFLAERGLSARAISEATGLSESQVMYRAGRFEVRLSDYRRGNSEYSKALIRQTECHKHHVRASRGQSYKVVRAAAGVA